MSDEAVRCCCVWIKRESPVVSMSLQDNGVCDHPKNRLLDSEIFQVRFSQISKSLVSPFTHLFPAYAGKGLVRGEPGHFVFSAEYGKHAEKLFRFQPRSDDVWLMSFPRSGLLNVVLFTIDNAQWKIMTQAQHGRKR